MENCIFGSISLIARLTRQNTCFPKEFIYSFTYKFKKVIILTIKGLSRAIDATCPAHPRKKVYYEYN